MAQQTNAGNPHRQPLVLPTGHATVPGKRHIFLSRIYSLLEQHLPDSSISVNWLEVQLGINRKTLYRKLERLLQLTPTNLIRQYRLQRAVDLLRIGYTITQTARLIGFKSSSHFASVFKEFYQETPSEFIAGQLKRT